MSGSSFLGWIDHDPEERQRIQRVLALFRERETRDELGFGAVRDAIADTLFPGTSTIETRLRYTLFVPWLYRRLEDKRTPAAEVAREARRAQIELVAPLLSEEDRGVFGRVSGTELKRLPSEVYWATLASWGILRYRGSMDDYHRAFDRLAGRTRVRRKETDEGDGDPLVTWDTGLPEPPADFPKHASFALRRTEAEYLRDRIVQAFPRSLMAWLANDEGPLAPEVGFPWAHPRHTAFLPVHREQVHHAHLVSEVTYGAAILYNLSLADLTNAGEVRDRHAQELAHWVRGLHELPIDDWSLDRLFHLFGESAHLVSPRSRDFAQAWLELARTRDLDKLGGAKARDLVRRREIELKGPRSRYLNARARDQWSGAAGLYRQSFRWGTAQRFLGDIHKGLQPGVQ
jgi:hypothetical protein